MSSPTEPTASIDDLPWEMIRELFKHLGLEDLMACSMVNRRWHSVYAALKLHRLFAIGNHRDYRLTKWSYPTRRVEEVERCSLAMFCRLTEKPLLSNLKYLALSGCSYYDQSRYYCRSDLNELNRFQQLVHLEIRLGWFADAHLNLPKLKVLVIYGLYCDFTLSIDCPELDTLLYRRGTGWLDVKHSETIRMLETDLVCPELARFKSVECLVTNQFKAISQDTLLLLPRLRELVYDRSIEYLFTNEFCHEAGSGDRMKRKLSEFVDEAKRLRGSDFQFIFAGLQLANVNVDLIDFGAEVLEAFDGDAYERVSNEYIYMKNYHLIMPGAQHFVRRVNYTRLLSYVTKEFPRCFSQKFTGIRIVRVDGIVKDPDHLLWFLKSLRFLDDLVLDSTGLSQEFYDQLPASAHSLVSLKLKEDLKNELHLNFDFVGEFSSLSELEIQHHLSLRSTISLFRWSDRFKNNPVIVRSEGLGIVKESRTTLWKVRENDGRMIFQTWNADEMIKFLEGALEVVNYFDRAQKKPETSPASE